MKMTKIGGRDFLDQFLTNFWLILSPGGRIAYIREGIVRNTWYNCFWVQNIQLSLRYEGPIVKKWNPGYLWLLFGKMADFGLERRLRDTKFVSTPLNAKHISFIVKWRSGVKKSNFGHLWLLFGEWLILAWRDAYEIQSSFQLH